MTSLSERADQLHVALSRRLITESAAVDRLVEFSGGGITPMGAHEMLFGETRRHTHLGDCEMPLEVVVPAASWPVAELPLLANRDGELRQTLTEVPDDASTTQ